MAAGNYTQLDGDWRKTTHLCTVGGKVFAFDNGIFYSVNSDGGYEELSNDWRPNAVVAANDAIYVFDERGTLYKLNPADGSHESLEGDWRGTQGATFDGTHLVAVCQGAMYRVEI